MALRALAKMTLRFGTVAIPIKVASAFETPPKVEFRLLHPVCGSPLKQEYVCTKDGAAVKREDAARGYEYAPGEYLVFTQEEVDACGPEGTGDLRIDGFLGVFGNPDPLLYEHPYYLMPDKGGEQTYAVLAATLARSTYKASGVWCLRGKEQPVIVSAHPSGVLVAMTRRKDSELRDPAAVGLVPMKVTAEERALCLEIVKGMVLHPRSMPAYKDEQQAKLRELIATRQALVPSTLARLQQQVAAMTAATAEAEESATAEDSATKRNQG